jgi:peptidyl-prolyl cis-trans isomerase C
MAERSSSDARRRPSVGRRERVAVARVATLRSVLGGVGAALVLLGCRCEGGGGPDASVIPSASAAGLSPELAARVLVKIGDRTLTVGDYAAALERLDRFERARYQSPERRRQLLERLIDLELLAAEARRRGLDREPEVRARMDQALRDLVLADLRASLPGPEALPEPEVRAYYAAHRHDFSVPERRRLSVIELADGAAAERVLAAARGAAPSAWGALVTKHSLRKDPAGSGAEELRGDVGFVTLAGTEPAADGAPAEGAGPGGAVPDAVRRAGFAIEQPGGIFPEVVHADGHAWIVRLVARNPPGVRTFAEAERSVRVTLARERIRSAEEKLERDLRQRFPVEIDRDLLATVPALVASAERARAASPVASAHPVTPASAASAHEATGGGAP